MKHAEPESAENYIGSDEPMPHTAGEYLNDYYKEPAEEMKEVVTMLEAVPLVRAASLEEAWSRNWIYRDDLGDTPDSQDTPLDHDDHPLVNSLTKLSLNKTIEQILDSEEDAELTVNEVEELPVFLPALRSYLRLHPSVVSHRPSGFTLLRRAFKDYTELELGIFPNLTGEQVVEFRADMEKLVLLDLSGNHNIEVDHLGKIIANTPVTKLYIWNNQRLPLSGVAPLVGPRLLQIFHRDSFIAAHIEEKRS
jgi:hypothetical protein